MRTIVERMNKKILQVIIFAEGTRSADGELQPFKKGPFVLAIEAGVPVVPVSIIGSREIMPKGSFLVSRGEITVRVGEPISVVGLVYEDRDHLREIAQAAVAELKGRQKV
jgi:1-acyl-sn-glycerol-3-phosphate acyltransferase